VPRNTLAQGGANMKIHRNLFIFRVVSLLSLGALAIAASGVWAQPYTPPSGFVPNKDVAVRVAEAILPPIYGEKQVEPERPFSARLKGHVWTVTGHLNQPLGGVAEVKVSKKTGQILSVTHGK
jgi:hypothetical protein